MRRDSEKGQAILLVLVALSIFLLGAVGLAIDASQMYSQRQMAQAAADGAAQAGILSIFDKTNTAAFNNAFGAPGDGAFNCTTTNAGLTPCAYALSNRFGGSSNDLVTVDFPTSAAGVTLSTSDPVNLIRVRITRTLPTGLIQFVGPSTSKITATATAAVLAVVEPIPILVLHPTMSGSFQKNGGNTITICGGPDRSVQVNSESATSIVVSGNGSVDLSRAGPKTTTPSACDGQGADFGDFGGPTAYPGVLSLGTDGSFVQPASPIRDPLIDVPAPTVPTVVGVKSATILPGNCSFTNTPCAPGIADCPATMPNNCTLYSPGLYTGGINAPGKELALFKPGLYYLQGGGFQFTSNTAFRMAQGWPDDPSGVTGQGAVFYNTGNNTTTDVINITSNSGQIQGVQYPNQLLGSPESSIYKGILFFQDRTSAAHAHTMQGGGGMQITGTIYLTNTPTGAASPFQSLSLQGNSGSATQLTGQIIVDQLSLGGGVGINMHLSALSVLTVRRVALVR